MSPSSSCFSLLTSLTTSPLRTVTLLHLGSWRVEDTTYLGRPFSLSAHASLLDSHRAANHSSLRRPSSRASVPSASSNSTLAHSSRSLPPNWPNQPPSLKPSSPSGSWTTPSNETFVLITIFPMVVLLLVEVVLLGVPDEGVGEVGETVTDGPGIDQAHGFLVAGLAEEALAGPEHDRVDRQPQLVGEVVLDQRVYELEAGGDDDVPRQLLLQRRDLAHHVALEHRRVVPRGIMEGRGHDVLGLAVQPVRQGASPRWPPRGEELVGAPAQQHGLGAQRLVEQDLGGLFAALELADLADPAAEPEALLTGRVLDDSVERDVLADDDLSHLGSPFCARCGPINGVRTSLLSPWRRLPGPARAARALLSAAGQGAGGP